VVSGIYDEGPIHLQDKQYTKGKIITQSAVGLLQYPLEVDMAPQLKVNDLLYWEKHTKDNGFYTGDSSYSIAWLALGNRTGSDSQFGRAFLCEYTTCPHLLVVFVLALAPTRSHSHVADCRHEWAAIDRQRDQRCA
jgi:hypothetical protein